MLQYTVEIFESVFMLTLFRGFQNKIFKWDQINVNKQNEINVTLKIMSSLNLINNLCYDNCLHFKF